MRWESPSKNEKLACQANAYGALGKSAGREAFEKRTDGEKKSSGLFLRVGCSMDKDMNATKGGGKGMAEWWSQQPGPEIKRPMNFLNRDKRAAADLGTSVAASRVLNMYFQGRWCQVSRAFGSCFPSQGQQEGPPGRGEMPS